MMVAHSRPPNHTGDHDHLNTTIGTRQYCVPLRRHSPRGGERKNSGNAAKPAALSPETTNPLTSSKPAIQKGEHNSQTETVEHPEQPSNTRLNTVPRTQERTCLPLLKTGSVLAFSARHNEMAGTEKGEGGRTAEQREAVLGPPYIRNNKI
ncbi:hypothetical protein E2C01_044632 [Portunus trituberculatus]|uniref:Uncharacterized protein n=1 Tax=Portunus trituberculatus TaxID=210409 RepID=A0A5B7G0Y0_PORTR|nr:hypothetical protein [Portunus trituberculatus]